MGERSEIGWRGKHPLFWLLLVIALILLGWALRATAAFTIPIAFAFFVAIAIAPVDYALRERLPKGARWLGHAVAMLILIVLLAVFFAGIGLAARQVLDKFPAGIPSQVGQAIGQDGGAAQQADGGAGGNAPAGDGTGGNGGLGNGGSSEQGETAGQGARAGGGLLAQLGGAKAELGQLLRERVTRYADTIVNGTATFLASLVLVLFLALFLLIEGPRWERKTRTVLGPREESDWLSAIGKTAEGVRWFVVVRAVLGVITAALYVGWLAIMGVDLLFVWGLITFLLNFVPTIGSLISGLLATGYAFYQLGVWQAVMVGLGLLVIEQIMGNYVDPRLLGRQLSLSAFVVLVSLLVWGWIWGIAGALLATPILIFAVSVAAQIPPLRPLAVLLSEKGEESVRAMNSD